MSSFRVVFAAFSNLLATCLGTVVLLGRAPSCRWICITSPDLIGSSFNSSLSVSGNSLMSSALRSVLALLHVFVQALHVTVLFGYSLCTMRRLMRSSQLSSTCSVMPLATKDLALNSTLLAVAVSHVQPSTVILCPLQVDSVDVWAL